MFRFTESRLQQILDQGYRKKILVLGDLMLDRYLWGRVSRISPEAPVPIVNIEEEEVRLGGAGNVANNLIGLGAIPVITGVVGNDDSGRVLRSILQEKQLNDQGLIIDEGRPTTMKTRIIGNDQHIARVDREKTLPVDRDTQARMFSFVEDTISDIEGVIIQDYNKGVVVSEMIRNVIKLANDHHITVTADPKFSNFWELKGVTLFKPNKKEAEEALAMRIQTDSDLVTAGKQLVDRLGAQAVLITRGKEGMALFEGNRPHNFLPTRARKVADVSGAGDTVIATSTFALAAGASVEEAVTLANYAAGLVCEEVGVVPVDGKKLVQSILRNQQDFEE
jgi:rfaE bifunctional protein kinase chain/domain